MSAVLQAEVETQTLQFSYLEVQVLKKRSFNRSLISVFLCILTAGKQERLLDPLIPNFHQEC